MKRQELIRYLETHGCEFFREGSKHTVYVNHLVSPSPSRDQRFSRGKICRELKIPQPKAS